MKRSDGAEVTSHSTNQKRLLAGNKKNKPETVSSTEESGVVKPSANFSIVDIKDYDITEKTTRFILVNHVFEKPRTKNGQSEERLKKPEFNFMIDLKTLIYKTSVDPKLLQLKICVRNKQKKETPEEFSPVFSKITRQFSLLFASDRIVIPEELKKKQLMDQLQFGHPCSRK